MTEDYRNAIDDVLEIITEREIKWKLVRLDGWAQGAREIRDRVMALMREDET